MIPDNETQNYETLRDCLSELLIAKLSPQADKPKRKRAVKGRKNEIKPVSRPVPEDGSDAADLSETIEVRIASLGDVRGSPSLTGVDM